MQHVPLVFYRQQITNFLSEINILKKRLFIAALARLASFVLFIVSIYYTVNSSQIVFPLLLALTVLLFIISLRYFFNIRSRKNLADKLLFINSNEETILNGGHNDFSDGSSLEHDAVYASDLDVAGPFSIYHHLNRTTTSHGAEALAVLLNKPSTDPDMIVEKQAAIQTLAPQVHVRQMITARGLLNVNTQGSMSELSAWISSQPKMLGKSWLNVVRFVLPLLNIAAFVYYLDGGGLIPVLTGIAISWLIIATHLGYIHQQHSMLGKKQSVLDQYSSILEEFYKTSTATSSLLAGLSNTAGNGRVEIKKLSSLTSLFDQRLNMLVNIILNSFLLYDVHCMMALERWKERNSKHFEGWIRAVGDIEMLNSLATFAFNNPDYCFPAIKGNKPNIIATQLAHPLISRKEAVANDLAIGEREKLCLITGSNMSGKSTFLRAVGINLLLAQCGAPVCATSFSFFPMQILSSIRINDSLQDHTSYFMAELKRLHTIIGRLENNSPALVLIDEVLRGTNSDDKSHGSESLIKRLTGYNCLALFATHDLSLASLEQEFPQQISNYCFESRIENGELLFDYKLHPGVAKNRNATFLMKKMGIITS